MELPVSFADLLADALRGLTEEERLRIQPLLPPLEPLLTLGVKVRPAATTEAAVAQLTADLQDSLRHDPYQNIFRGRVATDPNLYGRVLDIGCGGDFTPSMRFLSLVAKQVDGVDPSEDVARHPHLTLRWHGVFEEAPIPESAYDLAVAYNVVEHVQHARPFFEKLSRVLRPGGTFWALSPNSRHPFAWMSRTMELIGVKAILARHDSNVNPYSAYYRLNSPRQVGKAIAGLGFDEPQFFYMTRPGWERGYFPRVLTWGPRLYDVALGERVNSLQLLIGISLRRSAG